MSNEGQHPSPNSVPPPLPWGVRLTAGVLLLIPVLALVIVPIYARTPPRVWGMPFFYWYQFAWVFLAAAFTFSTYLLIRSARRRGGVTR